MYLIRSIHTKWELRLFFTELAERNFSPDTSFWRTFIDRVAIRDHVTKKNMFFFGNKDAKGFYQGHIRSIPWGSSGSDCICRAKAKAILT